MNKLIGYAILLIAALIGIVWFVIPLVYFNKNIKGLPLLLCAWIGYYGLGILIWKLYGKKIVNWINQSKYF